MTARDLASSSCRPCLESVVSPRSPVTVSNSHLMERTKIVRPAISPMIVQGCSSMTASRRSPMCYMVRTSSLKTCEIHSGGLRQEVALEYGHHDVTAATKAARSVSSAFEVG